MIFVKPASGFYFHESMLLSSLAIRPLTLMSQLGRPFGFLEKGTDVSGLMGATQFFARYGTVVRLSSHLPNDFELRFAFTF